MTLPTDYTLAEGAPDIATYLALRAIAGLSPMSEEGARIGLPGSCHAVSISCAGTQVGMGRVVGDGGLFFQIVDIAVHPDHQRRGLGAAIMTALVAWLDSNAPPRAYVSLLADGDADKLYAEFGFVPTAPASVGMARRGP